MDAWLSRTYARQGPRYIRGVIVVLVVGGCFGLAPFVVQIWAHYEGLSLHESIVTWLVIVAGILLGALIPLAMQRRNIRALLSWTRGERSDPLRTVAEEAAFNCPGTLALSIGLFTLAIPMLPGVVVALSLADHGTFKDWAVLFTVAVVSAVMGMMLVYFFLDLAYRPIRATFQRASVDISEGSLETRLPIFLVFIIFDVGLWVGILNVTRDDSISDLLFGVVGAALLVTVVQAAVLVLLLSGTVLGPIHDLITGTRWIAAGGLGWRVPVTTSDEFAELTTSFNEMAEGLQDRTDELRDSRARLVASSDAARRKVERDLHDGAQQHLVLLDLKLGLARRALEKGQDPTGVLDEAKGDLDQALRELRDLAHGIYPSVLSNDGLPAALREAANRSAIVVHVEADGARRYRPELEAAVYFCCLEALQNAGKHAGDSARVWITVEPVGGQLHFEVSDDGLGFDPPSINGSAGLQNMADRIGALGGAVRVSSKPGEGTKVTGSVPLGGRAS